MRHFLASIVLSGVFGISVALGQGRTTGGLTGHVAGESGAPVGQAVVEVVSMALIGGPRVFATDVHGRFRFLALPPGLYRATVTAKGYKTVEIDDIKVSVGMNAEIPVTMTIHAGEETVRVRAESPPIDSATSAMPTVLPPDILRNIPTDRDTSHILSLAPGINLESAYGGGEESGNAYQMDGVDISDPQAGAPWSFFNYSVIEEVELVGLGAPAEYGQFTGVVFNSVTKSGGNDFAAEAELFYTGKGLTSKSSGPVDVSATIEKHVEGTFQAGGPLRKDKLWYFVSGQYQRDEASEGGPIETAADPRLFAKLTWQVNPRSTVQGWLEGSHTKITGKDGDAFTPLEATTGEDNPELVWNLSWKKVMSANSVLSVAWGGYTGHHDFDPHNGFDVPGRVDAETGLASDNARQFGVVERDRNQINASLVHHTANVITGFHDVKVGMELEHSVIRDRYGFPGGRFFSDNEGPEIDPSTGNPDVYTLELIGGGYDAHGTNERISLYAQDSWRITPRVTINPGLRLDVNRGKVTGATPFKTHALAPRLGIAWDLRGDARSVLRAHYGRYYEAIYAAFYYDMDPGAFAPLTTRRTFSESGFTETITSNPGQKYAMDPGIEQPHLDQSILGFDQQLPLGLVLSGTLVYRKNADLIETVSRDGRFVSVKGVVPETGQRVTLFDHINPTTDVLIYTNPQGLNRTYKAGILSLTRRLRNHWQLAVSYVYSRTRGNIDNLGFDEFGIGANTPFFDGHFLDTPNSLVNAQGRMTHDQTHQLKLHGTWIVPALHLSFSAAYTYHSGDTWTPRADCLLTDDGNGVVGDGILGCHTFPQGPVEYFAEPRGSRRLPPRNELDLRAEWRHEFGKEREIKLLADVFNVTNRTRATEVEPLIGDELGAPASVSFPRNIRFGASFAW